MNSSEHLKKLVLEKMEQGKARLGNNPVIGITTIGKKNTLLTAKNTVPFLLSYPLTESTVNLMTEQ